MTQSRAGLFCLDVGPVFLPSVQGRGRVCVEGGMKMGRGWQELGVVDTIYEGG
jgi:hypothetical protein